MIVQRFLSSCSPIRFLSLFSFSGVRQNILWHARSLILVCLVCALNVETSGDANAAEMSHHAFGGIQPRVSPDGNTIAVSYQGAICTVAIRGGTLTKLSRGEGFDTEPAWSPDGKQIAFVNSSGYFAGLLRLVRADDGTAVDLGKRVRAQGPLYYHPSGERLLGRLAVPGDELSMAWFDLTTKLVVPVSIQGLELPIGPFALSHDGLRIAFVTFQDVQGEQGGNNGAQADVWLISAKGGKPEKVVQHPARIYNLSWDAMDNGLYVSTDLGSSHNDLWHVPFSRPLQGAQKLTFGQADEDWPSVNRDGSMLVHTENHSGATTLIRHNLQTGTSTSIPINKIDFGEPTGSLKLSILDKGSGQPTVAKIFLRRLNGKYHAPVGALYRMTSGRAHFYLRNEVDLEVPIGKYHIVVMRGPEFRLSESEVELLEGETLEHAVSLERWTDAAETGWYSGENHIHANYGYGAWYNTPLSVLDQCEGEDLNVGNIMVANSDGDGVFDREFFRGKPDNRSTPRTILYWNQEFRSTIWGHMTLVNLAHLVEPIFTGFKDTTNPWDIPTNADIAEKTRIQNGVASYTHPANNTEDPYLGAYSAKGLPVDVALGRIDAMDVMGHGYAASVPLWYRLLNCGFRIPASAGTDCFLNRIRSLPPGWGRAYVRITEGLSYTGWVEGLRDGKSFVSNGPMIEFSVNGAEIGDAIRLDQPGSVRIRSKAWAQYPLERLEIIYNGRVVSEGKLSNDRLSGFIDAEIPIESSGWIAARVTGPMVPFFVGSQFNAHTSPIYIQVKNRPLNSKPDAEYFLTWIDRLEAALENRNRIPARKDHVELQLKTARSVYRKLARPDSP